MNERSFLGESKKTQSMVAEIRPYALDKMWGQGNEAFILDGNVYISDARGGPPSSYLICR